MYVLVRSMVYKKVKITWKLENTCIAIYVYTHTYVHVALYNLVM